MISEEEHTLEYYIVKKPKALNVEVCRDMQKELTAEGVGWEKHHFQIPGTYDNYSRQDGEELDVYSGVTSHNKYIMETIWEALRQYVHTKGGKVWGSWSGYTKVRYNKYEVGASMSEHCDHIHSIFPGEPRGVPILTVLGCISEGEGGGNLVLAGKKIRLEAGDLLLFPSGFMYPHYVTPVSAGTRITFVSWVY